MKVNCDHFLHAVLDHLGRKEVLLTPFVYSDAAEVFEKNGTDSFSGMGHVYGAIIITYLREIWQSAAVIQVKMTKDII